MSATGAKRRSLGRAIYYSILLIICVALTSCTTPAAGAAQDPSAPETGAIIVKIMNPEVKEAVARVVETFETDSLDQGKLSFSACLPGQMISVSTPGYYTESILCSGGSPQEYSISLDPLNAFDNPNYGWIEAGGQIASTFRCANCHANPALGLNEYPEWERDGHASALVNPYFRTTYLGTNLQGEQGGQTVWSFSPDGRRVRLPYNPSFSSVPDYGPGFQLDYPNEGGNCAYCHAPAAIPATQQAVSLSPFIYGSGGSPINVVSEGVTCDVCHKATGVVLDGNKLPFAERPGILSFSLLRPGPETQFMAGPGAHPGTSVVGLNRTCSAVFSESEFCAPCHYGKFSGVEIYASYKEWLESPYSKPDQNYRSCQDCHMVSSEPIGSTSRAERSACSEANLKFRDFNHNMMNYGLEDPNNPASRVIPLLVKQAATISIEQIVPANGQVSFHVKVVNSGAGHKFPTDSPLRHLILWVDVKDSNGTSLSQVSGPMIARIGDPEFAGFAGEIYANLLKDTDTNIVPAIAYWNPVQPAWQGSDTRLLPHAPRESVYTFAIPSSGSITITARLIYRNAFSDIASHKQVIPVDIEATAVSAPVPIPP